MQVCTAHPHDRIEQGRGVAAMHNTERVVDRQRWRSFEHDEAFRGGHRMEVERLDDTFIARLAGEDRTDLVEAG
jgi:hypothetical protein